MTDAKPKNGLAAAIADIAAELGTVVKERIDAGRGGSYNAFTVDKVYEAVRPMMAARGIAVYPQRPSVTYVEHVRDGGGVLTTAQYSGSWLLVHALSGDEQLIGFQADARDTGDKAPIQAAQQAFKYALVQLFQIGAGDPEAENSPERAVGDGVVEDQLTNMAKEYVYGLQDPELDDDDRKAAAKAAWPDIMEKAGVSVIRGIIDRDKVTAAADVLYADAPGKLVPSTTDPDRAIVDVT